VRNFELPDNLLPNTFVVVRIDGRGFTKYDSHQNRILSAPHASDTASFRFGSPWGLPAYTVEEKCFEKRATITRCMLTSRYCRLTTKYNFVKPNDRRALDLMNGAAEAVMKDLPDLVLAYGQSDEFRYVFLSFSHMFDGDCMSAR
jgi:tRNA(His) 5'-end guanylyltransferase